MCAFRARTEKNKRVNLSYVGSINLPDTKNQTGQVPPLGGGFSGS